MGAGRSRKNAKRMQKIKRYSKKYARALRKESGILRKWASRKGVKGGKVGKGKGRAFGTPMFETGLIPQVPGYPQQAPLGLPAGATPPTTIYQVLPTPNMLTGPLPRPYGPRDNQAMALGLSWGRARAKKNKSLRKRRPRRFGQTPGTPQW